MKPSWSDAPRTCSIAGCDGKHVAKSFCDRHYRRFKKHGDPRVIMYEQHGMRRTKVYKTWCHIKDRCTNPDCASFKDYGARGITVCDEWRDSFSAFFADMGHPPTRKHQIDRVDNDAGYSKENCRWALPAQNNQNRRSTILTRNDVISIRASDSTSYELADIYGVSYSQIRRVKTGRRWANV